MRAFAQKQRQPNQRTSAPRARSSTAVHGHVGRGPDRRAVPSVLEDSGQPLESGTRAFMEARFGHDFGAVRVHADTWAAASAEALDAHAYTVGNHIVLGQHQPAADTTDGRRLLAHELTHVVQQSGTSSPPIVDPAAPHEQEARAVARAVATGTSGVHIGQRTGVGLARDDKTITNPPLTDTSKMDPRFSPRYIDNIFQGVTFHGLNGAFTFDWTEGGKTKQVTIPLSEVNQNDSLTYVGLFDVQKSKAEAQAAVAQWTRESPAGDFAYYSFYQRPDGIIMPTEFSINSTPKFHAMWPGLRKDIAAERKDIREGLQTLANAINPFPGTTVDEYGNLSLSSNPLDWLALIQLLHARRLSKLPEEGHITTKLHSGYDVPYKVVGPHDKLAGTSVYVLKDAEGTVLYVGKGDALDRLREHIKDPKKTQWFGEIAEVEVPATGLTNTQALAMEEDLIGQLDPLHNVDRTPFKSVFGTTMEVGPNLPKPQKPLHFAVHWGH